MSNDKKKPPGNYEVGYGKPPEHTRFKPGRSGNAKGRPRKSKDLNRLIQAELDKTITVQEGGREKHITKREAVVTQLINRAIKGDVKPLQMVLAHLEKHREVEPFSPTEDDDVELLRALNLAGGAINTDTEDDDGKY